MYCLIYGESKLFILYMNIGYAFIIIDLISCVRCMDTEKHYCKYIIHRSMIYCPIYCESKLRTLSMHL